MPGRGAQKKMYQIILQWRPQAIDLAKLWYKYTNNPHIRPQIQQSRL